MASLRDFWHRLLRALGMGALAGPDWVQPSNAVTRAIYERTEFVTMTSWEVPAATPVAATVTPSAASVAAAPAPEAEPPARNGVAA